MTSSETKAESIAQLRDRIDTIDDAIIELLIKRIELSNFIMRSKVSKHIVDPQREHEIIRRYSSKLSGVSNPLKAKRFVSALVAASNLYPES
jgi:chorismate mutase